MYRIFFCKLPDPCSDETKNVLTTLVIDSIQKKTYSKETALKASSYSQAYRQKNSGRYWRNIVFFLFQSISMAIQGGNTVCVMYINKYMKLKSYDKEIFIPNMLVVNRFLLLHGPGINSWWPSILELFLVIQKVKKSL